MLAARVVVVEEVCVLGRTVERSAVEDDCALGVQIELTGKDTIARVFVGYGLDTVGRHGGCVYVQVGF